MKRILRETGRTAPGNERFKKQLRELLDDQSRRKTDLLYQAKNRRRIRDVIEKLAEKGD
jgi:hypothetical protein